MLGIDMFEGSPMAMSLSRLDDGRVLQVNTAYTTAFGITREAIIGRTPAEAGIVVSDGKREQGFAALRDGFSVTGLELEVETPVGAKVFSWWSKLHEIDGIAFVLSTLVDITAQRRAIEDARAASERFDQLAQNIHEVFWLSDPDNQTIYYVSPVYEKIFGRTCQALYANARDWLQAVHPDDRLRLLQRMPKIKDGPLVETFRVVVRGQTRTIQVSTFPVRDDAGNVIRIAGVSEDRSDQLVLEDQMRQTQKLESLGLLAGGVAHDFNNVLAVIGANAGLLTDAVPVGHPDRELVDEIESAVQRAAGLTRQLLAFSRKEVIEPIVLDVNSAICDTRKMLRRMLGEDIVIETSLDPDLGRIRIDPGYFVQLLMNIAVNARDAMPRGGCFTISTRSLGERIVIELSDTGVGMPPEVRSRVFEPFFTTKGIGKGTGLGLSVVHGIVQQALGAIELESELGQGTLIRLTFPLVSAPAENFGDGALASVDGHEKIVLVDDDVFVRKSTSRALRARGYTVLEAGDAKAALRLLRDHGADVDLLLTDVVMPGTDGRELAEAARSHRPSLEVLYMSGYTDDAMIRHGLEHDRIPFIEKPFRTHAIASKVRNLLDARRKLAAR
jgi:two-component system cell cycle sensor histidine kinase/response regulator CckA